MSHSQLQILFLLTVTQLLIFEYKECSQFDFHIDHLVISMCKVVSCAVGKRRLHASGQAWDKKAELTGICFHFNTESNLEF